MQIQWQYMSIKAEGGGPNGLVDALNMVGKDGWQACHIEKHESHSIIIVKRPKDIQTVSDLEGLVPGAKGLRA